MKKGKKWSKKKKEILKKSDELQKSSNTLENMDVVEETQEETTQEEEKEEAQEETTQEEEKEETQEETTQEEEKEETQEETTKEEEKEETQEETTQEEEKEETQEETTQEEEKEEAQEESTQEEVEEEAQEGSSSCFKDLDEDHLEDLDSENIMINSEPEVDYDRIEKRAKKRKRRKILLRVTTISTLLLAIIYGAGIYFFMNHFYFNAYIEDIDVSFMKVSQVHKELEKKVSSYELTLLLSNEETEIIKGKDIELSYVKAKEIQMAMGLQNPYKWPQMLWKHSHYYITIEVEHDEDKLEEAIENLECNQQDNLVKSISAYPEIIDGKVEVVEEIYGTYLVKDFQDIVAGYIYTLKKELDMEEEKCYIAPKYHSESEGLLLAVDTINTYLNTVITYEEGEVLDGETIGDWIIINKDKMSISLSESKMEEFANTLALQYNTVGTTRTFTNPVGKTATVTGGTFGWTVNKVGEVSQIKADLKKGGEINREITYSKKGISHGATDWGDTYACLDLSAQKVYMVSKGEIVVTSDVVTGNVAGGSATPQGVYPVNYKTKNAVLRGAYLPDGTREYESPVAYWIPFNGGIGFHDASWRSSYGGDIYKNNGSHGCVNMPLNNVSQMYEYLQPGTPVVCHY